MPNKKHFPKLAALLAAAMTALCGCQGSSSQLTSQAESLPVQEVTGTFSVTAFNVGKADALVLQTEHTVTVVDTGLKGDGKTVEKYLTAQGISKIDNLIITHFDKDHVGGAARLCNRMEITNIFVPDYESELVEYQDFMEKVQEKNLTLTRLPMKDARTWTADDVTFKMYAANETDYGKNEENDFSIALYAVHGEKKFFFAGDAEDARMQEMMDYGIGKVDFLKFPYHGNYLPNTEAFLDAFQPDYTVVCCSEKEDADPSTVETLKKRGIQTHYTKDGNVTYLSDGKTITVST